MTVRPQVWGRTVTGGSMDAIERLLAELEGVRPNGQGWIASCPNHDDGSPSLSINPGDRGWLVHCFAGCRFADIIGYAGLTPPELFYDYEPNHRPDSATTGLRNLMIRLENEREPELFQDTAWRLYPHRERAFVLACAQYPEIASAEFTEAMKMWTIIRDGFLFTWLGSQWVQARETAATKLRNAWKERP